MMKCCASGGWFGPLTLAVMRTRRTAVAVAIILGAIVLSSWLISRRPVSNPEIRIGLLAYGQWGEQLSLCARVGITNAGRATIRYNQFNFSDDAWVQAESKSGWARFEVGPLGVGPLSPGLLKPGSNAITIVSLPKDTLRWQVYYRFRAASWEERVASRVPFKWQHMLHSLSERFSSEREEREVEAHSAIFECPSRIIGSPGGLPSRLPHHLTCGSASGGSGQINGSRIKLRVLLAVMHLNPLFL
jgi:hypothetical protein